MYIKIDSKTFMMHMLDMDGCLAIKQYLWMYDLWVYFTSNFLLPNLLNSNCIMELYKIRRKSLLLSLINELDMIFPIHHFLVYYQCQSTHL